jgi:(p)ppGpp synthase/HD superfamily hydrolase
VSKLIHWRDLGQWEITDECLAVAWLHDVLEDTETSLTDLEDHFGDEVGYQVLILSKDAPSSYDVYLRLIKKERVATLVKMADTLSNLEASILSGEMKRINKYSKQLALLTEV